MEHNDRTTKRTDLSTLSLTQMAVGSALIAASAWISIPTPIPFSLQTFAVCALSALLGPGRGTACVLVYLLTGAAGLPVFSGFRGGIGALFGVTGGYLIGFILTALTVGYLTKKFGRTIKVLYPAMALGVILCYIFGTAWFVMLYTRGGTPIGIGAALSKCVLPFIPADTVKIILAAEVRVRTDRVIRRRDL